MLRSILVRNQVLNDGFRKALKLNIARCMSTELARRKLSNKLLSSNTKSVLVAPQWTIQMRYYADLPSHIKVNLPALSPTMETGSIVSWAKKEGDKLNEGDLLCEIETDKATMGFETPEEGYLAKIIIPSGTKNVAVGNLLCIIVSSQEEVAAFKDFKDDGSASPAPPKKEAPAPAAPAASPAAPAPPAPVAAPAAAAAPTAAPAAPAGGRVLASPMARRLAEIKAVRLGGPGSGLYGSIKSGDIRDAPAGAPSASPAPVPAPAPGATFVDVPLTSMRATIAKRLTISKQTIPHYQLSATVNIEKTIAMRKAINAKLEAEKQNVKLSINDFIIKAVASACKRVPAVNAHWMDSFIREFVNVDVSVAVATPTGLITPILFNADSRGIIDLAKNMKVLGNKAKEGTLQPNEFQGGTVTVSNLGMYGITMFNAIVNPPQSLIIACGGLQELVIADENSPKGFRPAQFVTFTASADHRVIDGAVGAQFMKAFKDNLEDPANIIL